MDGIRKSCMEARNFFWIRLCPAGDSFFSKCRHMPMEVSMKYYMVTGASSGIGRETAIQLSSESSTILLVARRRENLEKVKQLLKGPGIVMPCDLTLSLIHI